MVSARTPRPCGIRRPFEGLAEGTSVRFPAGAVNPMPAPRESALLGFPSANPRQIIIPRRRQEAQPVRHPHLRAKRGAPQDRRAASKAKGNCTMRNHHLALGLTGLIAAAAAASAMPPFGEWAGEASIETLDASSSGDLNTAAVDGCASHSPDGLTLVFNSNRRNPGVFLMQDLYMATRSSTSEGFGDPVPLDELNTAAGNEFCPTIVHGNRIYFSKGVLGGELGDIYVTKRTGKGWSEPEPLDHINTPGMMDETAAVYEDEQGREVMLFSRRAASPTSGRIYQSVDGGPPELLDLGPSVADNRPSVTHDGLTLFFDSIRAGGQGGPDLYYSTRSSTSEPWGPPVALTALNASGFDARPYIGWDGTFMTFSSTREGATQPDMWFTTRDKLPGN